MSGAYSPAQRDLYTAVLNAQKDLIEMCSEAAGVSLMDLHRESAKFLTTELKQISVGFQLSQSVVEKELYPHFVGHHIGIGVCTPLDALHPMLTLDRPTRVQSSGSK